MCGIAYPGLSPYNVLLTVRGLQKVPDNPRLPEEVRTMFFIVSRSDTPAIGTYSGGRLLSLSYLRRCCRCAQELSM